MPRCQGAVNLGMRVLGFLKISISFQFPPKSSLLCPFKFNPLSSHFPFSILN